MCQEKRCHHFKTTIGSSFSIEFIMYVLKLKAKTLKMNFFPQILHMFFLQFSSSQNHDIQMQFIISMNLKCSHEILEPILVLVGIKLQKSQ